MDTPVLDTSWMLPAEAAAILKVHPRTVGRWVRKGKITRVQRTIGGHRRYNGPEIRGLAAELTEAA